MDRPLLELQTDRLFVQVPGMGSARRVLDYCVRNREHLERWEPPRSKEYYTLPFWRRQLSGARSEFQNGHSVRTVLVRKDRAAYRGGRNGPVVGVVNLSQIVRGAFQAAVLGYSLDEGLQGQGLMTEAIDAVLRYSFEELDLHRVMANYRPENSQSARVLEKLGFQKEGYAREYLFIDGAWRDHVLTALLQPDHRPMARGHDAMRSGLVRARVPAAGRIDRTRKGPPADADGPN